MSSQRNKPKPFVVGAMPSAGRSHGDSRGGGSRRWRWLWKVSFGLALVALGLTFWWSRIWQNDPPGAPENRAAVFTAGILVAGGLATIMLKLEANHRDRKRLESEALNAVFDRWTAALQLVAQPRTEVAGWQVLISLVQDQAADRAVELVAFAAASLDLTTRLDTEVSVVSGSHSSPDPFVVTMRCKALREALAKVPPEEDLLIDLSNREFDGHINLDGIHIGPKSTLSLNGATVRGYVSLKDLVIAGRIVIDDCRIVGAVSLTGTQFETHTRSVRPTVSSRRAAVSGKLELTDITGPGLVEIKDCEILRHGDLTQRLGLRSHRPASVPDGSAANIQEVDSSAVRASSLRSRVSAYAKVEPAPESATPCINLNGLYAEAALISLGLINRRPGAPPLSFGRMTVDGAATTVDISVDEGPAGSTAEWWIPGAEVRNNAKLTIRSQIRTSAEDADPAGWSPSDVVQDALEDAAPNPRLSISNLSAGTGASARFEGFDLSGQSLALKHIGDGSLTLARCSVGSAASEETVVLSVQARKLDPSARIVLGATGENSSQIGDALTVHSAAQILVDRTVAGSGAFHLLANTHGTSDLTISPPLELAPSQKIPGFFTATPL